MPAKKLFEIPFIGIDHYQNIDLLVNRSGEISVVLAITNPIPRFAANAKAYEEYHQTLGNVLKVIGEGYYLQKLDVLTRTKFQANKATEFLQQKYDAHFCGRTQLKLKTYLVLTQKVRKRAFYLFDPASLEALRLLTEKVIAFFPGSQVLSKAEIQDLLTCFLCMRFDDQRPVLENLMPGETMITMGDRAVRSISLVDPEHVDLPPFLQVNRELTHKDALAGFPVDLLSFVFDIPGCDALVYHQLLEIPDQTGTLRKLEQKKKRHSGIPDPANHICVEDIELLLTDVARDNQLLVNAHFNLLICGEKPELVKAGNFIESSLFQLGILPSRNAYNQLELFRSAIPGNGIELKDHDQFLTTANAALCLFFKETIASDEPSDVLFRFTDRQGIPLGIDLADLPMRTGRISNRNKVVIGPSGSGKSFFMNSLIEQYMGLDMDVVIIDTGHSYSSLCQYFKGTYITYADDAPITMNPFQISPTELNIEKRDFLCTLIAVVWKGSEGTLSTIEHDVIAQVITAYFDAAFADGRSLGFNSFYEFALGTIPGIRSTEQIPFDLDEFRFVLKKFYRGGEFEEILNKRADHSLLTEKFVVFEIDAIKEHKILFPICTLIVMDVFIQKMRHRSDRRKALIVEEAWKAIASPLMAGNLLYLYKTVRKFWGEAIVVTQEINDIIGNVVVKDSIINSSDTVCLLDQTKFKDNYEAIANLLSINETEKRKIFSINQFDNKEGRGPFKEVYIRRGLTGEVYGVEVSLYQYLTYTTEKPEKEAVAKYLDRYGDYLKGLNAFVDDLKESGLSLAQFVKKTNQTPS